MTIVCLSCYGCNRLNDHEIDNSYEYGFSNLFMITKAYVALPVRVCFFSDLFDLQL